MHVTPGYVHLKFSSMEAITESLSTSSVFNRVNWRRAYLYCCLPPGLPLFPCRRYRGTHQQKNWLPMHTDDQL